VVFWDLIVLCEIARLAALRQKIPGLLIFRHFNSDTGLLALTSYLSEKFIFFVEHQPQSKRCENLFW
jgi:hypothetical protein